MPARSEAIALLVVAALHLIVGMVHHYAHVIAGVQNTMLELLFILLVVAIAPWAAVYVAWKRNLRTGAALFSLSMAASFLFGYLLHFVIDSPDHHAKVMKIHVRRLLPLGRRSRAGGIRRARLWVVHLSSRPQRTLRSTITPT